MEFLTYTKHETRFWRFRNGAVTQDPSFPELEVCHTNTPTAAAFCPNGDRLAFVLKHRLLVLQVDTWEPILDVDMPNLFMLNWSFSGNYIITFQRRARIVDREGEVTGENLRIFDIRTGELVFVTSAPKLEARDWPCVYISPSDQHGILLLRQKLYSFRPPSFDLSRLEPATVRAVAMANMSEAPYVAWLEHGQKGAVVVQRFLEDDLHQVVLVPTALTDSGKLCFSPRQDDLPGLQLLAEVKKTDDAANRSYYGISDLLHITDDGGQSVMREVKGQLYGYKWSPVGDVFTVSKGEAKPIVRIIDGRRDVVRDLGPQSVETFAWAPQGDAVLLAGLGNMNGDATIYTTRDWQPYSHFNIRTTTQVEIQEAMLGATLFPRIQTKQRAFLMDLAGHEVWSCELPLLLGVFIRPQLARPVSIDEVRRIANRRKKQAQVVAAQPYRPPGFGSIVGDPTKSFGSPTGKTFGATRRSAAKRGRGATRGRRAAPAVPQKSRTHQESSASREGDGKSVIQCESGVSATLAAQLRVPIEALAAIDTATDMETKKQLRQYVKKLKQIFKLKVRQAEGEDLTDGAKYRIQTEEELRREFLTLAGVSQ